MDASVRSLCTAGVAVVGAGAIAIAPSVGPPAPPAPAIQLAAAVAPAAQPADYFSQLFDWWQGIFWPSLTAPFPAPPNVTIPTPTSIASWLEVGYHAIEPWVRWGFELATWGVGWIPWVGWLAPQIMIWYNFGESIVHAISHNTLDWLNGNGSFWQNVSDGVSWTIDAFIQLGIDQWNFWLPNLPPLPPFGGSTQLSAQLNSIRDALKAAVLGPLQALSASLPSHDSQRPPPVVLPGTAVGGGAATSTAPTAPTAGALTTTLTDASTQVSRVPNALADPPKPAPRTQHTGAALAPAVPRAANDMTQAVDSVVAAPGITTTTGKKDSLDRTPANQPSTAVKGARSGSSHVGGGFKAAPDNTPSATATAHADTTKKSTTKGK